jgi:glutathione S-transferase
MLTLYGNAFSPFSRKVRIVLEHKGIDYQMVDGLARGNRPKLALVSKRLEVPAIDHDGLIVVNSSDIVAYLERIVRDRPVYPADAKTWVKARAWERCADTVIDPILVDISYWVWAIRKDSMPEGLLDAARSDLAKIYDALERELEGRNWVCGEISIADIALFPHLSGARLLQVPFEGSRYPNLLAWYKRARDTKIFAEDLERTKSYLAEPSAMDIEREKIFWRGDRIEWILARGYHEWFVREIQEGRVMWPDLGIPARG